MAMSREELLQQLGIDLNQPPKQEVTQPVVEPKAPVVEDYRTPKEKYIETQVVPAGTIQVPSFNFQETPQEREDRLARDLAMNKRLDKAKNDYETALQNASDREFKQSIWAALGNAMPGMIAGATAMNTKAAVKPASSPNIQVKDLVSAEDKRYKTEYENILNAYKQLRSGSLTAKDRLNAESRLAQMGLSAQAIQENINQRASSAKNMEEERFENKMQKFGKEAEPMQDALTSLKELNQYLGGNDIDNLRIDDKTGKLLNKEGKEVDLPGISIPGIGRVSALTSKARGLQGAFDSIFLRELKARSGSAVVQAEFDRLKKEFEQGKFNTEGEMLRAMQRYKRAVEADLKQVQSRYEKPIVEEAKHRGLLTQETKQNLVERTVNGRPAIFDADTKQFVKWK